jgi:type VI protein secretion system component VasK
VAKLSALSADESPLVQLFCLVSKNTSVDSQDLSNSFESIRKLVPQDSQGRCATDAPRAYLTSLFALKEAVQGVEKNPGQTDLRAQVDQKASEAREAVHNLETTFHLDRTVTKLMNEPVNDAVACTPSPSEFGGGCKQFSALKSKFPFNTTGADASVQELDAFFAPSGTLWSFVDQNLKGIVSRQGSQYFASGIGGKPVRQDFLNFLDRAAQIRDAFYPGGSQQAQLHYSITSYPVEGVKSVSLVLNGQPATYSGAAPQTRSFVWPGNASGADLIVELVGGVQTQRRYNSVWGVFHLLQGMKWTTSGSGYDLQWILRERDSADPFVFNGNPITLHFGVSPEGSATVFRAGYLDGLRCVPGVSQ